MFFLASIRRAVSSAATGLVAGRSRASLFRPRFFSAHLSTVSAPSDTNLLRALDTEIRCAEKSVEHYWMGEMPNRFPFDMKDEPCTSIVCLTRNFDGERVVVEASMPNLVTGEEGDDEDEGDVQNASQSSVPLVIKLSKGDKLVMEFHCTAFPDEISIGSMSVKENNSDQLVAYDARNFMELDEDVQTCFRRYLEIRGISPSNLNFLHEYMINKDGREYLLWLKSLKAFIQK